MGAQIKRYGAIFFCLLFIAEVPFAVAQSAVCSRILDRIFGKDPWENAGRIVNSIEAPAFPDRTYNIKDFGAKADGVSDARGAIMEVIDKCNREGGGTVFVPAGDWFVKGPIHLKSNVNLHLADGAVVRFSTEPKDYLPLVLTRFEGVELMNYSPLIYAHGQENVAVTGEGTLDGQANDEHWWPWKGKEEYGWQEGMPNQPVARARLFEQAEQGVPVEERVFGEGSYLRPNFVEFYRCNKVLVQGVTIKNSPMWVNHPVLSENVTYDDVDVISHGPNNDGLDPESSKNVLIKNCYFDTGDDCIAIKSGRNADGRRINVPSENIVIRNCTMKDGHGGVVIGSEMTGGARNIYAENCYMDSPNLDRVLRIKTNSVRGGVVENVNVRNIEVGQVKEAILWINFYYEEGDADQYTPAVRNISMSNITSKKSNYGVYTIAYSRSPATNISLENCNFQNVSKRNLIVEVRNLHLKNVTINGELYKDQTIDSPLPSSVKQEIAQMRERGAAILGVEPVSEHGKTIYRITVKEGEKESEVEVN